MDFVLGDGSRPIALGVVMGLLVAMTDGGRGSGQEAGSDDGNLLHFDELFVC